MRAPIPIERFLVPAAQPAAPDGFTTIDEPIVNGLPHTIALDDGLSLAVVAPSGLATRWRDADPTAIVSSSDEDVRSPDPAATVVVSRCPARLLLRAGTAVVSSVPLAAGVRRAIPEAGGVGSGVRIAVVVLAWDIRAGSLRGPGDFGSRIALATRRADRAGDTFETPAISPDLIARLKAQFRTESRLGLVTAEDLPRFARKKVVLR